MLDQFEGLFFYREGGIHKTSPCRHAARSPLAQCKRGRLTPGGESAARDTWCGGQGNRTKLA